MKLTKILGLATIAVALFVGCNTADNPAAIAAASAAGNGSGVANYRVANLRLAPMIDTKEAWNILNTTGADVVESRYGRLAFTVLDWNEVENIENIRLEAWEKDDNGDWKRYWWGTFHIGNFGERAFSKAANSSLYMPVNKPIEAGKAIEAKYEIFVNFKDGTTEYLEKEIVSVY